ncbi:MAG TPA: carboxylating nicotinate-nucleotide diphosphorylase, partial [Candidatus Obscuribacterales bacterium]
MVVSSSLTTLKAPQAKWRQHQESLITESIRLALREDLSTDGDLTSRATVPEHQIAEASIVLKEAPAVIAGLSVVQRVFHELDPQVQVAPLIEDGRYIHAQPIELARITGSARSVLTGERLALNLLQRMSGIATTTRKYVDKAKGTGIAILDTRKTAPGLRVFDRLAVLAAGGTNHRFGLFDQILIKDNHVRLAGGIAPAIRAARNSFPGVCVEIETTTPDEVREAVEAGADKI